MSATSGVRGDGPLGASRADVARAGDPGGCAGGRLIRLPHLLPNAVRRGAAPMERVRR